MNVMAINNTIRSIRARSDKFDMSRTFKKAGTDAEITSNGLTVCGEPSCIAGHVLVANLSRSYGPRGPMPDAAFVLGLEDEQGKELFMPSYLTYHFMAISGKKGWITAEHAVAVLEHLRDHGEVDWTGQWQTGE